MAKKGAKINSISGLLIDWTAASFVVTLWAMDFDAGVAQLVEHELPKLGVAGSNPVARSKIYPRQNLPRPKMWLAQNLMGALLCLVVPLRTGPGTNRNDQA